MCGPLQSHTRIFLSLPQNYPGQQETTEEEEILVGKHCFISI